MKIVRLLEMSQLTCDTRLISRIVKFYDLLRESKESTGEEFWSIDDLVLVCTYVHVSLTQIPYLN